MRQSKLVNQNPLVSPPSFSMPGTVDLTNTKVPTACTGCIAGKHGS